MSPFLLEHSRESYLINADIWRSLVLNVLPCHLRPHYRYQLSEEALVRTTLVGLYPASSEGSSPTDYSTL